jgi:hypothetical protein
MDIRLTDQMIDGLSKKALVEWLGSVEDRFSYTRERNIDLRRFSPQSVQRFHDVLKPHDGKIPGVRVALRDIKVWLNAAVVGADKAVLKSTQSFSGLVFEYLKTKVTNHWLFKKDDGRDVWRAFYAGAVKFHPKEVSRDSVIPARTSITLYFVEFGQVGSTTERFEDDDVKGMNVVEALRKRGYVAPSEDLLNEYATLLTKFGLVHDKIGKQFLAVGIGTENVDDERWNSKTFYLDADGEPSRVVVDVLSETDQKKGRGDSEGKFDPDFWNKESLLSSKTDKNLPKPVDDADADGAAEAPSVEVPLYPTLPVFDLRRHTRLRVHAAHLAEYVYDKTMGARLILPKEVNDLVGLLVSEQGEFRDIVKGKGGGAVILCAGPAGCGKTLTAEVYSEVMEKALYSVQCSQLGTDEVKLEAELLKVFDRAQRWGAILLLDEADVYVRSRGIDLQQNAIVGVFLRVLEYYAGVLFMTTNRSDLVDDAITSRCLARIDYEVPTPEDQKQIWFVLASVSGMNVPEATIDAIVLKWPRLSGRDVKQLLKLSSRVMKAKGEKALSIETVTFVKRFKPTPGNDQTTMAATSKRLVASEPK